MIIIDCILLILFCMVLIPAILSVWAMIILLSIFILPIRLVDVCLRKWDK